MVRLSLRRLQPGALFASFLGILDIKLGCEIILLFGLINKVAGVYGLITVFVGGSFVQFLFYAYSIATLFAFLWALGVVKRETAHNTLLVAHLYLLDHVILQIFHYIFFYTYWYINPHNGERTWNSRAQQDIFDLAVSRGEVAPLNTTDTSGQAAHALQIWNKEKGFALGVISVGFLLKIYFILVLYSYAAHLRSNSYHNLPLTAHARSLQQFVPASNGSARVIAAVDDDDDRELANAEAEVARINEEAAAKGGSNSANSASKSTGAGQSGQTKAKDKDEDSDFESWE